MTDETRNTILVLVAVATLGVQFWTAQKPVETKIAILFWLAEFTSAAAVVAAAVFLITTDKVTLPFACAFYNFLVQGALFIMSPRPAARKDILLIVFVALFLATIPTYALAKMQSRIVSILEKLTSTPSPTPSRSPLPQTP
jgi:NADH:ubiquinone oxidoreductase subunit 2 (subunit N)